jgi:hypothetical protein
MSGLAHGPHDDQRDSKSQGGKDGDGAGKIGDFGERHESLLRSLIAHSLIAHSLIALCKWNDALLLRYSYGPRA